MCIIYKMDVVVVIVGLLTAYAINAYHLWRYEFESRSGEVYSIQQYVIKCLSMTCGMSKVFSGYSGFLYQ